MRATLHGEHALPGFTGLRRRHPRGHGIALIALGEHALPGFTGLRLVGEGRGAAEWEVGEHALPGFTGLRRRVDRRQRARSLGGEHALPGFTGLRHFAPAISASVYSWRANTPFPASRD